MQSFVTTSNSEPRTTEHGPRSGSLPVQPGGGYCYSIELAWGRLRRWYLKRFRRAYIHQMAALRDGDIDGAPHEILDPRDLKYCSTMCSARWRPEDDPFRWRGNLPFTRWGLAELQIIGWPLIALIVLLVWLGGAWQYVAIVPAVVLAVIAYFFRDPTRIVPTDVAAIVSPADGKVVEIKRLEHDAFIGGPAVRVGIFLSLFNVHINRAPLAGRIVEMRYKPGEFLNAMRPESAERNESMWIGFEESGATRRRFSVRQISGLVARRIVCALRPGQSVTRGEKFGMIKLGSRTELVLPAEDVELSAELGQSVHAGSDVLARWKL